MNWEEYKVKWMVEHGYTLRDYIDRLMDIYDEQDEKDPEWKDCSLRQQMEEVMDIFDDEGFDGHGEVWLDEGEFLTQKSYKD